MRDKSKQHVVKLTIISWVLYSQSCKIILKRAWWKISTALPEMDIPTCWMRLKFSCPRNLALLIILSKEKAVRLPTGKTPEEWSFMISLLQKNYRRDQVFVDTILRQHAKSLHQLNLVRTRAPRTSRIVSTRHDIEWIRRLSTSSLMRSSHAAVIASNKPSTSSN